MLKTVVVICGNIPGGLVNMNAIAPGDVPGVAGDCVLKQLCQISQGETSDILLLGQAVSAQALMSALWYARRISRPE